MLLYIVLLSWTKQQVEKSNARWLTKAGTRVRSISAQLGKRWADGCILKKSSTSTSIGGVLISRNRCGSRCQSAVSMMASRSWMNSIAMVMRRGIMVMMNRAVRRMRIARMSERMRRVRMMTKGVHRVVRMTRMVCVVNGMRMVTAVVVMMMVMTRMRTQIGSSCGRSSSVRKAEEVGQILPSMLHAHRAHKGHAHLIFKWISINSTLQNSKNWATGRYFCTGESWRCSIPLTQLI